MAESIWAKGKLTPVFQPVGARADGEARFRRANFDLLQWAAVDGGRQDQYVVPLGINRITNSEVALEEAERFGHEFGYYSLDRVVVDVHEADGKSDTWKALHSFGYV